MRDLHTIGFEKRKIEDFVEILLEKGIKVLVDIRAMTHSRRVEFSGKRLAARLAESGIDYIYMGDLGTPRDLRQKFKADGDYGYLFKEYRSFLRTRKNALNELLGLARTRAACLFCYERDAELCHRREVARKISALSRKDIRVINL